jgi:hypothetical protein
MFVGAAAISEVVVIFLRLFTEGFGCDVRQQAGTKG